MQWRDAVKPVAMRALQAALVAATAAAVDVGLLDGDLYHAVVAVLGLFGLK